MRPELHARLLRNMKSGKGSATHVAGVAHVAAPPDTPATGSGYVSRYVSNSAQVIETTKLRALRVKNNNVGKNGFERAPEGVAVRQQGVAQSEIEPKDGLQTSSNQLWCIDCGRFPHEISGGLTYRHGVSFYCLACWPV